jgi:2',3'-cyclic-nucleotide 2'-phosphodiesterase (5'-nucleotidase family)
MMQCRICKVLLCLFAYAVMTTVPVNAATTAVQFQATQLQVVQTEILQTESVQTETVQTEMARSLTDVIGSSENAMSPNATRASYGAKVEETSLGDFVADALRLQSGTDVAVIPGSHLIKSLPGGDITAADVTALFDGNAAIGIFQMSEAQLYSLMELSVAQSTINAAEQLDANAESDFFLQISGFTMVYDVSQPAYEKVKAITMTNGKSIHADGEARIAIAMPIELMDAAVQKGIIVETTMTALAGDEAGLVTAYIESHSTLLTRPKRDRIETIGTRDNTLFEQLNGPVLLPYVILLALLFSMMRNRYRLRNIDGSYSKRYMGHVSRSQKSF